MYRCIRGLIDTYNKDPYKVYKVAFTYSHVPTIWRDVCLGGNYIRMLVRNRGAKENFQKKCRNDFLRNDHQYVNVCAVMRLRVR